MTAIRLRSTLAGLLLLALPAAAADWPQLQADSRRTGHTRDSVPPPYRARWIWCGPDLTLRNRDSEPGWSHDLRAREGYSYPMPRTVGFTLANSVQPVVANGRVFVGTLDGRAFAIDTRDGNTLWSVPLPGGTSVSAAVGDDVVVFVTLAGAIHGFSVADGRPLWTETTRKSITSAPCRVGSLVFVAGQDRHVRALSLSDGSPRWLSVRLEAPFQGGIAADDTSVFVGTEDLWVQALRQTDGTVRARHRVTGQSFRLTHPVVHGDLVFVTSAMTPAMGSEYVNDPILADARDIADEDDRYRRWLSGDSHGGRWPHASTDFRHLFALRATDLSEPFLVPCGPSEGVGLPPIPPAVDGEGRVLCWWPTKFPKFTKVGAFGTRYSLDVAAVDPVDGRRIPLDRGRLSGMWPGPETDNLYALSVAGDHLWMRQAFRGTQNIRLTDARHHHVSARVRHEDGGVFGADVVYFDRPSVQTATPDAVEGEGEVGVVSQSNFEGRTAAVVVDRQVYLAERFGVTALEHRP